MREERVIIFIDGSNFYFKLKDLDLHKLAFNYSAFVQELAGIHHLVKSTYFVGEVRTDGTPHTQKLYDNQQRLLAQLKKHAIKYQFGYLLKSNGVYHEKGVDVHIAVAMLIAAYEDVADKLILVSSDTDLIPAIQKVQEKGKIVEYVGFSHKISLALARCCKETKTLTREDIQPFAEKIMMKKAV